MEGTDRPTLEEVVSSFRHMTFVDTYQDEADQRPIGIEELRDPDVAMGVCDLVAQAFLDFLHDMNPRLHRQARLVETENVAEWGYQGTTRYGAPTDDGGGHTAVVVDDVFIDFTAAQFIGEKDLPVIKQWPIKTHEWVVNFISRDGREMWATTHGPFKTEGMAIIAAAQMAREDMLGTYEDAAGDSDEWKAENAVERERIKNLSYSDVLTSFNDGDGYQAVDISKLNQWKEPA